MTSARDIGTSTSYRRVGVSIAAQNEERLEWNRLRVYRQAGTEGETIFNFFLNKKRKIYESWMTITKLINTGCASKEHLKKKWRRIYFTYYKMLTYDIYVFTTIYYRTLYYVCSRNQQEKTKCFSYSKFTICKSYFIFPYA